MEYLFVIAILLFIIVNRLRSGEKFYNYVSGATDRLYDKYASYSFKVIRQKIKDMGMELTPKEYLIEFISLFTSASSIYN